MEKNWRNIADTAFKIQRPELDWSRISQALGQRLAEYAAIVELEKISSANPKLKHLGVSFQITCKQIMRVFMEQFKKGFVRKLTLKLTYSYLAGSHGKEYRHPSTKTIMRHIARILEMPNSFIRWKERSQLDFINNLNCIALSIDPRLIFFKSPVHQKAHEAGTEVYLNPYKPKIIKPVPATLTRLPNPAPENPVKVNPKAPMSFGEILMGSFSAGAPLG